MHVAWGASSIIADRLVPVASQARSGSSCSAHLTHADSGASVEASSSTPTGLAILLQAGNVSHADRWYRWPAIAPRIWTSCSITPRRVSALLPSSRVANARAAHRINKRVCSSIPDREDAKAPMLLIETELQAQRANYMAVVHNCSAGWDLYARE